MGAVSTNTALVALALTLLMAAMHISAPLLLKIPKRHQEAVTSFAGGTAIHVNAGIAALAAVLVLGKRKTARGIEWMLASESVALDMLGFALERDVAPGEAIYIDMHGRLHSAQCAAAGRHTRRLIDGSGP